MAAPARWAGGLMTLRFVAMSQDWSVTVLDYLLQPRQVIGLVQTRSPARCRERDRRGAKIAVAWMGTSERVGWTWLLERKRQRRNKAASCTRSSSLLLDLAS